eukprot:COSAG05_NODE_2767_length_2665_cov_2.778254_3_plen_111_part_01
MAEALTHMADTQEAAEQLETVGDRLFAVSQTHSKKLPLKCSLKVGQMGVQLFSPDPKAERSSWHYGALDGWEWVEDKRLLVLTLSERSRLVLLGMGGDQDGADAAGLMTHF